MPLVGVQYGSIRFFCAVWVAEAATVFHFLRGDKIRSPGKGRAGILPVMKRCVLAARLSLRQIAAELNARGEMTPRGGQWSAVQVQRVIRAAIAPPTAASGCFSSEAVAG